MFFDENPSFFLTFQMLSISKLEIQEVLFATRSNTHSFFSKIKSLNMKEVKVSLCPSCPIFQLHHFEGQTLS